MLNMIIDIKTVLIYDLYERDLFDDSGKEIVTSNFRARQTRL